MLCVVSVKCMVVEVCILPTFLSLYSDVETVFVGNGDG